MAANKGNVVTAVEKLAVPVAEQLGLSVWDIEFVKEGAGYYLRIYIDKDGPVAIEDCEAFSRAIDGELDRADPIDQSYCLEVSSPGIERELKKDRHFEKYMGSQIKVRLIRPDEKGRRELVGQLTSFDGTTAGIETEDGLVSITRGEAAWFRLYDDGSDLV